MFLILMLIEIDDSIKSDEPQFDREINQETKYITFQFPSIFFSFSIVFKMDVILMGIIRNNVVNF